MSLGLTERQTEVLQFVRHHKNFYGDTPTLKEITKAFGWSSLTSADQHIGSLCAKKYLVREHNDLRVVDPDFCPTCGGRS